MSLVAYEDSEEEISDDEEESKVTSAVSKSEAETAQPPIVNGEKTLHTEEAEEIFDLNNGNLEDVDDNDGSSNGSKTSSLLTSLPAPKSKAPALDIDWVEKRPKSKNQPVKILIPSLTELEEEEPEKPVKKKIKPSSKGSGLFALLPKPKSESSSLKLIPPSVKKKPATLVPKQVNKTLNLGPSIQKPPNKINLDYNDSDDEDVPSGKSIDFFSLTEKPEDVTPITPVVDVPGIPEPAVMNGVPASMSSNHAQPEQSHFYYPEQSSIAASSTNDFMKFQDSSVQQNQPLASADYIPFDSSDINLDEEALRQLCGRKDRKAAASQIVDVHGDNLVMNSQEWLMQSLSEEKVQKSHKKKKDGPSTVEKRKHQITYLAHQAKENELELKNTWANNRQTRKQTQAKYGF